MEGQSTSSAAVVLGADTLVQVLADSTVGGATAFFTFSPDGEQVAFRRNMSELWLAGRDGDAARLLVQESKGIGHFEWLDDGRRLAYMKLEAHGSRRHEGGVRVLDLADGSITPRSSMSAGRYDISRDGLTVLYDDDAAADPGLSDSFVVLVETAGLEPPDTLVHGHHPHFARDEQRIVYLRSGDYPHTEVRSIRPDGTGDTRLAGPFGIIDLFVSPDGRHALVLTQTTFELVDLVTGAVRTLVRDHDHTETLGSWENITPRLSDPLFDPDGTSLYYLVEQEYWDDGCP